jgi:peptidoglycan hydrolase CwlO-like protein
MQNLETQDFQNQVLTELRSINTRLSNLEAKVDKLEVDIRETAQRVDKWEERFLQLSRDNLSISRTVIIAAAAATIVTPLVQSLAPAIAALLQTQ